MKLPKCGDTLDGATSWVPNTQLPTLSSATGFCVFDHGAVDDVGDSAFEDAQCFDRGPSTEPFFFPHNDYRARQATGPELSA